jgi:hypothetical protein
MAIDYLPLDYNKVYNFFKKLNKEQFIYDFLDTRFCKYVENGVLCGRKSKITIKNNCCKKHLKYMFSDIKLSKRTRKKDIIYKCVYINKKQCGRNVLEPNTRCLYHKNSELTKNNILENNILLEYNINNKTRRKEKIKNFDFQYIEKYRNMEMLQYLIDNKFDISNDGIRKKVKKEKWHFTINLNKNLFIDNNDKTKYGKGLLNLIIYLYNFNIKETILYIDNYLEDKKQNIHSFSFPSGQMVHQSENNISKLPKYIKNQNDILPTKDENKIQNIKKYLIEKRNICENIITEYINNNLIYSDIKNNCVFVNKTKTFSLSKGIGNYKFNKCSGVPDFIKYDYGINSDTIYLFESPIDALSFININKESLNGSYLSTNGDMMINKVGNYIKEKCIKNVYTCFDNDEAGDKFHDIIFNDIKKNNLNIIIIRKKPINKDFNEDLKICKM